MTNLVRRLITADAKADKEDPMYVWITPDGEVILIGERNFVLLLHEALTCFVLNGEVGESMMEDDVVW